MRLAEERLGLLDPAVGVPGYDRGAVTAGIVHLGVGGFHRAHEAYYVDRLLGLGVATEWGICGVGLLPQDARMRDVLAAQDRLYTLVERRPDGTSAARVVGSLVDYLFAPDDPEAVVERIAAPTTRIVSLTITEGGYNLVGGDGDFDTGAAAVVQDARPGATPATAFGLVTEALRRRRARGTGPLAVLSCDNLEDNGGVARRAFVGFAEMVDLDLAAWVSEHVSFPSSMVDRITPATTAADRRFVHEVLGIDDGWPVVCEPWVQWVVQDDFAAGRPPWEDVGVQVVEDVRPYELVKLRLLNASHQVMGYLGSLAGFTYVHDVCRDPAFVALLSGYMDEATPTLDPVPGIDLADYRRSLLERFTNAAIADTLARQCVDATERLPKFLLPVVRERLVAGGDVEHATLAVAGWAQFVGGVDDAGRPLEVVDVRRDEVVAAARREDPAALLGLAMFDGLRDQPQFVDGFVSARRRLAADGARAAVDALVGPSGRAGL